MRPIDADNLLKKVELYFDGLPIVVHHDMVEFIKNAPTADVVEVKHGEWIWQGSISEGCWVCSECKYRFYQIYGHENYCPHCGAKMDGKETEDGE